MTLVITMAIKSGIVMGADSKISTWDPITKKFLTPQTLDATKNIPIKHHHMAASFWGQLDVPVKLGNRTVHRHLINDVFPSFMKKVATADNVDTISEKYRNYINSEVDVRNLEFPFGIHMAGYTLRNGKKEPKIRHVCLSRGDDKDPIQKDPEKFKSNDESQNCGNPPYAMVFNGFYYIVNALVNWVRQNCGDIYSMFNPQLMSIDQGINFTKYLINITKGFQKYAGSPALVGESVKILTINEKGVFTWYRQKSRDAQRGSLDNSARLPGYIEQQRRRIDNFLENRWIGSKGSVL
jgi:hypothetical protein